jgi:transposase
MASLTAKRIAGRVYYYLRECQRVDGRPKIVRQKYLGSAEDLVRALTDRESPLSKVREALVLDFGAVVALNELAQRIGVVETIDRHVPKNGHAAPSVGIYLLVAALNRCVHPCSKARMKAWVERTCLPRLLRISPSQLTSQRFWDNMDRLNDSAIQAIERDITSSVIQQFQLDLRCLLYDATNFFSFIDTFNGRSTLAQRGHSKEGRESLRIFGLALLVTTDFDIPLFHRLYPGNQPDAPTFRSVLGDLAERYRLFAQSVEDITVVFDKGNNAEDIFEKLDGTPYHFVGSLVSTQHRDLLEIPLERFRLLGPESFPGVRVHRVRREVMGLARTVVVTHNPVFLEAQKKTLEREIQKRQRKLSRLQRSLARWHRGQARGRKPSLPSAQKTVSQILSGRHMKGLFSTSLSEGADRIPELRYRFDRKEWDRLCKEELGKTILFTDREDWTDEQIVAAYRGQAHVESAFRRMKDVRFLSFRPQFHWTDQKVKVHALYCVLALLLVSLLRREVHRHGIDLSAAALLEELSAIKEVHVVEAGKKKGRPRIHRTLTPRSERQEKLLKALDLERFVAS